MKQKLPRLYGITVWDLRPLLSCCWGYSLGLFPLWMKAAMNQYADPFLSLPECSENILELFVGGRLLTRHGAVAQAHHRLT